MRVITRVSTAAVVALAALALAAPAAGAHEDRTVGRVTTVVGWATEPAVAGHLNAVQFRARRGSDGITGLKMKVAVTFGDTTREFAMSPVRGEPGEYRALLIPTRPGGYTFRFTGTVDGKAFDQSYTSGDKTFDEVREAGPLEFPVTDPSNGELAERVTRIDPRVVAAAEAADDAKGAASLGTILGATGLALGLIALAVALLRKPKGTAA